MRASKAELFAHVLQDRGTLALAEGLCMRLLDYGASSKERAKALLREIRALQVRSSAVQLYAA